MVRKPKPSLKTSAPRSAMPAAVNSDWLLSRQGRPMFIFAHQDDETVMAGIIQRIAGDNKRGSFLWWTNGDGPAPAQHLSPLAYGQTRQTEATAALKCLGISKRRKFDLGCSEIEIYRQLTCVRHGGMAGQHALEFFGDQAVQIETQIRKFKPDRVFVLAFQGGHPEHDLLHAMVALALQRLRAKTGQALPLIQSPAYELSLLVALRFRPWFRGDRRFIQLSEKELAGKMASLRAHQSQTHVMLKFQTILGMWEKISGWRGRKLTLENYLAHEEFGVVDPNLDYAQSPQKFDRLNYMFDDFEKIPIRFSTMVRPVILFLQHSI